MKAKLVVVGFEVWRGIVYEEVDSIVDVVSAAKKLT
jgi:hypothetical protein